MTLSVLEEQKPAEWDAFVGAHSEATRYHVWACRGIVERSFGHRTIYLSARRDGQIAGILPLVLMKTLLFGKFLVSMPYFNYGGLLTDGDDAAAGLVAAATELAAKEKVSFLEMRHYKPSGLFNHTKEHKATLILDLARDEGEQWKGFDTRIRNHIRKAQKSGLTVSAGGPECLNEFYDVFATNMRDLGTPVHPYRFFEELQRGFGNACTILLIRHNNRAIAGGVLLRYRDKVEVPWASSVRRYNPLCPNSLFYWEAIRRSIGQGARRFDFGRSTIGEGTYRFKMQWGARPVQLYWQYWLPPAGAVPEISPRGARFRLAIRVWRHLPLSLTRWVGPHIVRGIPG